MVAMTNVLHNTEMNTARPTEEAYAELQQAYDFYNQALFGGQLPPCLITFQRVKRTFGYFSKNRFGHRDGRVTDEIALNPEYFAVVPLVEILQTLVHEMTHLWQRHFGTPSRACYHNTEWADRMQAIGLMPSSTGQPGGKRVGQSMADYVIAGAGFEHATQQLLTAGFEISWLDRYPAPPPARTPPISWTAATTGTLQATTAGAGAIKQVSSPLPASALVAPGAVQANLVEHQKVGNRSNRSKYTCPECRMAVWGKPRLKVLCGECNVQLAEAAVAEVVPEN
jgi:predicted SprT family Zn-dependent metalloprotease